DESPFVAVHGVAVAVGGVAGDVPETGECGGGLTARNAHVQDAGTVFAGGLHARGRVHGGAGDGHVRLRVGSQLQTRLLQGEPAAVVGDRLYFGEQANDDAQRFVH